MFPEGSAVRRVGGEAVLLLGGGRALLMQLAHPLVARGVAEHSDFEADPLRRLLRTLRTTYAIAFGTEDEALAAAGRVNAMHAGVAGPGYRADDPDLLLWVHATLVDTALLVHARFVGSLDRAGEERYYREMTRMAELFGLPPERQPPDLDAFRAYVAAMVATLEVGEPARALVPKLFRPPVPPAAPLMLLQREVTAGLLPPRLRRQYGLRWNAAREAALRTAAAASRSLLPRLPPALRRPPALLLPPSYRRRPSLSLRTGTTRQRTRAP